MSSLLTCVDLFAGCGGLSLGLKQAGFNVKLAVEKSSMASETYYHNFIRPVREAEEWRRFHEDLSLEEQAQSGLVVRDISEVLESDSLLSELRDAEITLVAGGPPCQGFSSAGRRNPRDVRNELPWLFLDFVSVVRPKAVIIENVSGMQHDFRKYRAASPFDELRIALGETGPGYAVQAMILNAMHFGVPQHRPRVFLVALMADIAAAFNLRITDDTWDSSLDYPHPAALRDRPTLAPERTHFDGTREPRHLTVWDAISDLVNDGYKPGMPSSTFAQEMRSGISYLKAVKPNVVDVDCPVNHVLRRHSDQVKRRFQLYQYLRQAGIHPKILALPTKTTIPETVRCSMIHDALKSINYPVSLENGTVLARTESAMIQLLSELATKKHSQKALSLHEPAPTVLSLPDDFVHPTIPRIPTVRELARFQSFPDGFEFRSNETTGSMRRRIQVPQYTQVGNAVPPRLAQALGERLHEVLLAAAVNMGAKKRSTAVALGWCGDLDLRQP